MSHAPAEIDTATRLAQLESRLSLVEDQLALYQSVSAYGAAVDSLQSQMAAAMISFVLGVSLFSLGFLAKSIPVTAHWQAQALSYFNLFDQMNDLARGVLDTRTVIFYVSASFFFLFLTLRVVESRRWK